ncbi:kinase-like protein [Bimuria novae-zelandiae CBS 107.79]|uniref:non-specific serine/threonine protein kinase n=1 Tax=Bimuria novae-zelandiae CBS 107.79 TaxID=1447943 RepID=A0A6A5VKE7_9PLEO|nr:kinase-like protein [Bimuria novae-zelandiae CBS 107.79]
MSPTEYFSLPASFMTASPASFITTPSTNNSPAFFQAGRSTIETIMEVDEPFLPVVPQGPFGKLGYDYQAELRERELIQPFNKELNWSGKGQHVLFNPTDKVPVEFLSHLGASATARVEKSLCHFHIIQLVGSYLQGREFSLLMYPAADCHLGTFLEDTEDMQSVITRVGEYEKRKIFLCKAFHCLASAVHCAHQSFTKHMDIKPQNILVRQIKNFHGIFWRIYLSDFGLSRSFSGQDHNQTDGPTSMTPKYCAPEVYNYEPRGRSSDMFSLGCVYTEMLTVITDIPGKGLHEFSEFRRNEDGNESFHKNLHNVNLWINAMFIPSVIPSKVDMHGLVCLVARLISASPAERPSAEEVVSHTHSVFSRLDYHGYPGYCCDQPPELYVAYHAPPSPASTRKTART